MTTITLKKPITHNEKTYSELTFREPLVGDLVAADSMKGEMAKTIAIMAGMADVPIQVLKALPLVEFGRISAEVSHLMGEFPEPTVGST